MSHWDAIRLEARAWRDQAINASQGDSTVEGLLKGAAAITSIQSVGLPAGDPLLYKAHAILHSGFVWYDKSLTLWEQQFNQVHEYAHFWKHGQGACCGSTDLNAEATEDSIAIGAECVDGYGPHERRELEANVFAREFLLPLSLLRENFLAGKNAEEIAAVMEMPLGMVIHQLARSLLSPELEASEANDTATNSCENLDPSQELAVFSGDEELGQGKPEPPVLVEAGPGTGKTRTLVSRIVHLLNTRQIPPSQILALTYSNKAANEIYARVRFAVRSQEAGQIWMGTFHKFGLDLLRQYHHRLGASLTPKIIDPVDAQLLLEQNLARLNLKYYRSLRNPAQWLSAILEAISCAKDEMISPQEYAKFAQQDFDLAQKEEDKTKAKKALEVAQVYGIYQELLEQNNLLDYGDLIMRSVQLLVAHADVREKVRLRFRHILVDEYQDVNSASRQLLKLLSATGDGVWVVGDLKQAIYRFRGSSPLNLRLFAAEDFTQAKVISLDTNYRSQSPMVGIFSAYAKKMMVMKGRAIENYNVNRTDTLGEVRFRASADEISEAREIVEEIEQLQASGTEYKHQTVLCRNHKVLSYFAAHLERLNVPVLYLGNFFERPEIRDLLSVISLAAAPDGHALYRVAHFAEYQVSYSGVRKVITHALETHSYFPKALQKTAELDDLSPQLRQKLELIAQHYSEFHYGSSAWSVLSQYLFVKSNYLRLLVSDSSVQAQQKRLAIYQLLLFTYQLRDRFANDEGDQKRHFLNYVRQLKVNRQERQLLQLPAWAEEINAVRLMSVHAAKGLEFSAVHIPNLNQEHFPSKSRPPTCPLPTSILPSQTANWHEEEEECLFFVALSRARNDLRLFRARSANNRETRPSRFLTDLQGVLPRAIITQRPLPKPQPQLTPINIMSGRERVFAERALSVYLECPLKFYYQYFLNINPPPSNAPLAKSRLCVYKVWEAVKKLPPENRVDSEITSIINQIWAEFGPRNHAYEADYRTEAERMIGRAINRNAGSSEHILIPEWEVKLESGTVKVKPDFVEFVDGDDGDIWLRIHDLKFGTTPDKITPDHVLTLYDIAAEQSFSGRKHRIMVTYMTTGDSMEVTISRPERENGKRTFEKALRGINAGDFSPRPDDRKCPYCPHYFICPSISNSEE